MRYWENTVAELQDEVPGLRIIRKSDSKLMKWVDKALFWIPNFMDGFGITIGNRVYVPDRWVGTKYGALAMRHEIQHVRDWQTFGPLLWLTYVLPPVGPSLRAWWEWKAYRETLRWNYRTYGEYGIQGDIDYIVGQFCGTTYGWMFPFPKLVRKWCEREVEALKAQTAAEAAVAQALDEK